jgi:hypothetical protein
VKWISGREKEGKYNADICRAKKKKRKVLTVVSEDMTEFRITDRNTRNSLSHLKAYAFIVHKTALQGTE